jgi:hypothetical protein
MPHRWLCVALAQEQGSEAPQLARLLDQGRLKACGQRGNAIE